MNPAMTLISIVILLVMIGGAAYLLYRSGFRLTKLKAKLGIVDAEIERIPPPDHETTKENEDVNTSPAQFIQKATDGGTIEKARIKGKADSGARAEQRASGKGSRLHDVKIDIE
ncbi:MAG: hypothetical protein CSB13_05555 [Chloroflexi bacterium]|nr:MAG: hypothetical protein CSB13_05555 [Chloroflexota bacterium]